MLEHARARKPLTTKCLFTQNYHLYFRERANLLSNGTSGRRTCRSNWHIACKSAMAERKTCQLCEALMEFYRFLASALFISSSHFKSQRCVAKKSATRSLHILVWHHALQDNNVASKQPVLIFLPWTRRVSNCRMTIKWLLARQDGQCHSVTSVESHQCSASIPKLQPCHLCSPFCRSIANFWSAASRRFQVCQANWTWDAMQKFSPNTKVPNGSKWCKII